MTYQYQWVSSLQNIVQSMGPAELTETNRNWMKKIQPATQGILERGNKLGFNIQVQDGRPFQVGPDGRPPAKDSRQASTLEWAKRITDGDVQVLTGPAPIAIPSPIPMTASPSPTWRDPQRAAAITKIVNHRLAKFQKEQPRGYLVRDGSKEDVKLMPILKGHVQSGQYITKIRHTFTARTNDDLVLVPAKVGEVADVSEHEEVLRTVVFGGGRFGGLCGGGFGRFDIDSVQPRRFRRPCRNKSVRPNKQNERAKHSAFGPLSFLVLTGKAIALVLRH